MRAPLDDDQIQPASLDLRLGETAYRVRASFLPGPGHRVADKLERFSLHEFPLGEGAVLETGCVYIVPLMERLALPAGVSASANPKSSTGRLDIFTRVMTDHGREFDKIEAGYQRPALARDQPAHLSGRRAPRLAAVADPLPPRRGDAVRIRGRRAPPHRDAGGGRRSRRSRAAASRCRSTCRAARAAWSAIAASITPAWSTSTGAPATKSSISGSRSSTGAQRELVLDPDEFYILVSREAVHVPPDYAAEMTPFDPLVGEFRVHYAGFFDPGFGHSAAGGSGSRAVLEVRSHEVPFILDHGQIVGRLVYEHMLSRPQTLYGTERKSNYQAQG